MDKTSLQSLNQLDRKILYELDKNSRELSSKIAKKLNTSRQTIEYRIKNLSKRGIIESFNTAINTYKIGYKLYKFY